MTAVAAADTHMMKNMIVVVVILMMKDMAAVAGIHMMRNMDAVADTLLTKKNKIMMNLVSI